MSRMMLTQSLHRAKRLHPQRMATCCDGRTQTYAELQERVARLAAALIQLGLQPGDRVGVLAQNSDRYIETMFAIWWAGGTINPVNVRWSPREIAFSLEDCGTSILVVDDTFAPTVRELSERARCLRTVIHAGEGAAPAGMFGYEQLIAEHRPAADAGRGGDDLAGVFYTGGTTGRAKGVMLSHANLYGCALASLAEGTVGEDDVVLHVAPMFHLADIAFVLMASVRLLSQVVCPRFAPELVFAAIQDHGVSSVLLVPTMIQMLADDPRRGDYRLQTLRSIIYGASPISEAVLDRAMACFPAVRFTQCYGQTEMSPVVTILKPAYHAEAALRQKLRSAGRAIVGVEVRIVDADGGECLCNIVGEIAVRGPGMMQGYWNAAEQTAATLRDGWLLTGDGGYLDEDGFLFIVDRVKDMIVSGGENVYSAEVENAIAQHEAVATCAVIGIPDPRWGEAVHAVIVLKPGAAAVDAAAIRTHCQALIAGYKCPRSVEFRDALPLSGAGKVLKTVLREPWWRTSERKVG
ncbi:MAG TPA: long-chain fatty acid--CoA ligase [Solimonas sp.]|nr:long-chain fatty acid--CoA ligase [Solimonas sp.]